MSEIAVIGAGAWGTGISIVLGRKGSHRVRLWAHEEEVCDAIAERRVNERFLPGCSIPDSVMPSNDLAAAINGAQIVVSVMPSQHCRSIFEQMRAHLRTETLIISATKGLEESSLLRMTEVIMQVLDNGGHRPSVGALTRSSFSLGGAPREPAAGAVPSQHHETPPPLTPHLH